MTTVNEHSGPLTELNVVSTLEQASNPSHAGSQVQKLAETQLKQWEVQPGFHYLLQSIYLDLSNTLQVRWLAVIQFKNGVDKYWRSTRINAINKEEKASIRKRLFDMIDEQNNQLCIQNAQATSKIARLDFPVDWPDLFETLKHLLESEQVLKDNVKVYNVLMHVNQITKILGTARIGRCKPAFQSKVSLIFPLVVRIYLEAFDEWTSGVLSGNASNLDYSDSLTKLHVAYLAMKVLRRIISEGYERPHRDESVCDVLKLTITHFELLIEKQNELGKYEVYEKFIKCYGKLYYSIVSDSPSNFILLPCSIQILIAYTKLLFDKAPVVYNENSDVTGDFWEHTTIRGFLLLKKIINFVNKKNVITLKARYDKQSVEASINRVNSEFLNENLIRKMVDILLNWYLKLRPAELENWSLDPEEWINEQMATSYEYQIRPCAENFFQDLINNYSQLLVPYLLGIIESDNSVPSNSLEALLKKDAIYASFQLSAGAVSDMVDFDNLLANVFIPEASNPNISDAELKIIRRRVALIINEWCTVKCSDGSKQLCYKFFGSILASEEDKVVLLTVVQSLRTMVDDWNFNKDIFEPYSNGMVVVLLRKILPSVSLTETRLYVLNTLSDIIIQTKPLLNQDLLMEILQIVPNLWNISTDNPSESILCNALLRLLRHLVSSLAAHSYLTWDIAIPIIAASCDPSSAQFHLLNEDGFDLWSTLLQNYSPKEHPDFNSRYIELLPFLEYSCRERTEILPTLLEIVKSYALILPQHQFLASQPLMNIFGNIAKYLLALREDSFQLILEIWEILALTNESDYETVLLTSFHQIGVLTALFDSVFLEEALSSYQCAQIFQVLARVGYVNPDGLVESLSSYQQTLPTVSESMRLPDKEKKLVFRDIPFDVVVDKFVSIWITCFGDIYDPKFKKIHILGLSSLLRNKIAPIYNELEVIVGLWVNMLEELHENNDGDCEKYHLNDIVTEQSLAFYPLTNEQLRHHELIKNNDPVHNISLKEFIQQTMNYLKDSLGIERYNQLLNQLNSTMLQNLRLFLSISQ